MLAQLGLDATPDLVTLAALVTFLPGMTLTIGMRELATEHLQSGVANTASARQLLGLVFGVEIGRSIAVNWFGAVDQVAPSATFSGWQLLAAVAAGPAFHAHAAGSVPGCLRMRTATVLALVASELGAALFGDQAAAFVAALAIGVVGNVAGARLGGLRSSSSSRAFSCWCREAPATTASCSWSPTRRSTGSRRASTRS